RITIEIHGCQITLVANNHQKVIGDETLVACPPALGVITIAAAMATQRSTDSGMSRSWIAALMVGNLLVVTSAGAASGSAASKYYRDPGRIDLAIQPVTANIMRDSDVAMVTRDGKRLYMNVYRPQGVGRYPVIVSTSWYGKESFGDAPYREWHDQTGS